MRGHVMEQLTVFDMGAGVIKVRLPQIKTKTTDADKTKTGDTAERSTA